MRSASTLLAVALLAACASRSDPKVIGSTTVEGKGFPYGESAGASAAPMRPAASPDYGYTEANPVKVGGGLDAGAKNEVRYLESLRGPQGQPLRYERTGSCCPFETKNSPFGQGLLDVYSVTYEGAAKPLRLYIDMYDAGELLVPQGLTAATK